MIQGNPEELKEQPQEQRFEPSWDEETTRNIIKQYKRAPELAGGDQLLSGPFL